MKKQIPSISEFPRQQLRELIIQHGRALCDEPGRCEALLRDHCAKHRREVNILVTALKEHVAADLLNSSAAAPVQLLLSRLERRLQDHHGMTEEMARWAVESWALALGRVSEQDLSYADEQSMPTVQSSGPGPTAEPVAAPESPQMAPPARLKRVAKSSGRKDVSWRRLALGFAGLTAIAAILAVSGPPKTAPEQRWESVGLELKGLAPGPEAPSGKTLLLIPSASGLYGFIDTQGRVVIEPQCDFATVFEEDLSWVSMGEKHGFIDKLGQTVIDLPWGYASGFSEGLAHVSRDTTKHDSRIHGFIDRAGTVIIEPQWEDAMDFSEGLAVVMRGGKRGYIDKTGRVVSEPQWDWTSDFSEGLAAVQRDGKWGYIDKAGHVVIEPQWEKAEDFSEGLAEVSREKTWFSSGFIDPTGHLVIEAKWKFAYSFREGLAVVVGEKYGFIDKTGRIVSEPQWGWASGFSDGLAAVQRDGKVGFIDKTGNVVIEPQWDYALDFHGGLAPVTRAGLNGFIDKTGSVVIEPQWHETDHYQESEQSPVYFYGARKKDDRVVAAAWFDHTGRQIWSIDSTANP